jgi:hypothetical protein
MDGIIRLLDYERNVMLQEVRRGTDPERRLRAPVKSPSSTRAKCIVIRASLVASGCCCLSQVALATRMD